MNPHSSIPNESPVFGFSRRPFHDAAGVLRSGRWGHLLDVLNQNDERHNVAYGP